MSEHIVIKINMIVIIKLLFDHMSLDALQHPLLYTYVFTTKTLDVLSLYFPTIFFIGLSKIRITSDPLLRASYGPGYKDPVIQPLLCYIIFLRFIPDQLLVTEASIFAECCE